MSKHSYSGKKLTREQVEVIVFQARAKGDRPDLREADLSKADLNRADLRGVNLFRANLGRANLIGTNLSGADLYRTDLSVANLRMANLSGANLNGANLVGANFSVTNLNGANLGEARMWGTAFGDVDLSQVKGLETVNHDGPSTIGIDTLRRSGSKIPISFLRGCGLSDLEIETAKLFRPDLTSEQVTDITYKIHDLHVGDAIQFYSVFISYSHKDEEFTKRLHDRLQDSGVRCWFAPEDIQAGKKLYPQIDEAIRLHDKLLLVLSERSMQSEWVMTEIRRTRKAEIKEGRRKLFPIRLVGMKTIQDWTCFDADTGKDLAVEVREYHIPDFSNWKSHDDYHAAFARLLRDLKEEGDAGSG